MFLKQWCNLTIAQRFWPTKVCLRESKISVVSLVARLGEHLLEKEILKIVPDTL